MDCGEKRKKKTETHDAGSKDNPGEGGQTTMKGVEETRKKIETPVPEDEPDEDNFEGGVIKMDAVEKTIEIETPDADEEEDSSDGGQEDPFMSNVNAQNAGQSYAQCAPTKQGEIFNWIFHDNAEPECCNNKQIHAERINEIQTEWNNKHPDEEWWFCPKTCRIFLASEEEEINQWEKTDCQKWINERNQEQLKKENAMEEEPQVITSTPSNETQNISTNDAGYEN